ncbi:MAG: flippase-like domain-containing protein [Caldilineales bacterium]|nr:flippase-like domain-containing protein [Caldilineales bacterium]MDW8316215.1 lysylphosphatidylglycerol synthase transmembrane domain-containing protein [Anaerolineae bacterium]
MADAPTYRPADDSGATTDPTMRPASPHRPVWRSRRMAVGLAVAALCLALSLVGVDLREVAGILRETRPGWLAAALAMVAAATWAKGVRWRLLLYPEGDGRPRHGDRPSLGSLRLANIWLAGAALNLALPVPRSGDVARAYLAGEAGGLSKAQALGTVAAEKLLDMAMLVLCFLLLPLLVAMPAELTARLPSLVALTLAFAAGAALLLWQRDRWLSLARWALSRWPSPWSLRLVGSLERGVDGLDALRSPRSLVGLALWSAVAWALSVGINNAVFLALGLPSSWTASLFVLVVLQAGVALPSTPGKVGVFQVLSRWALVFLGYSAAAGLAYGILLYLVSPVVYMVAGAFALAFESGWGRRLSIPEAPSFRDTQAR